MTNRWDVPLDEDTKKLGRFCRVYVEGDKMYIHNGKAKPIVFPYDDSTEEGLYKTINIDCRAALTETGEYANDLIERLCMRILNALEEYMNEKAQEQYESEEEGRDDTKQKPIYLMKYTKSIKM